MRIYHSPRLLFSTRMRLPIYIFNSTSLIVRASASVIFKIVLRSVRLGFQLVPDFIVRRSSTFQSCVHYARLRDLDPGAQRQVIDNGRQIPEGSISKPLTEDAVREQRSKYGKNAIATSRKVTWYSIFFACLVHPFNILLAVLATATGINHDFDAMGVMIFMVVLSMVIRFIQEWKSAKAAQSLRTMVSNTVSVARYDLVGGSDHSMQSNDGEVILVTREILVEELVPGDWVKLSAGDLIPADILLIESKDLFVSQSSLTGEAIPVEKYHNPQHLHYTSSQVILNIPQNKETSSFLARGNTKRSCRIRCRRFFRNLFGLRVERYAPSSGTVRAELDNPSHCYMGTSVVSGTATGLVHCTGEATYFGSMAIELSNAKPQNAFQLGVRRISWIFFLSMICLVPPVLLLQGLMNNDWKNALVFSLAVAVGLTPEMLPMIVSATLARGAYIMSRKRCIVKNMDSIINLGGMDVLCTDKTGTLTENRVVLMKHVDYEGVTSVFPIQLAYLNSYFQTGLKNLMDEAVVNFFQDEAAADASSGSKSKRNMSLATTFLKVDEIPFDFVRRRMSVLLKSQTAHLLISKGAVDEMLRVCTSIYAPPKSGSDSSIVVDEMELEDPQALDQLANMIGGRHNFLIPSPNVCRQLTPEMKVKLQELNNYFNDRGLRVIAVAYKTFTSLPNSLEKSEEAGMTFAGFIAFQDPPKKSTLPAIKMLMKHNIQIKVLTGDSAAVCKKICEDIRLPVSGIVTTQDLEGASDEDICRLAEYGTIFAKLTPLQKADVVRALKRNEHVVGFLGDGINDAPALAEADIGISVDNGTDIARDAADIILLEKDLMVVADGVLQGRKTYGNTMKYIVMAISSNFGNVFSVVVASSWLKFLPMLPIHILTQNLLYDISQIAIPWDVMDEEFLMVPHRWSMKSVLTFMLFVGPWSSIFDIATFAYMYFHYNIKTKADNVALFQTTWFTVGILTQLLVVHMIRTQKIPFIQSRASSPVMVMTLVIMGIGLALPYIPKISDLLDFVPIEPLIYPFIFSALLLYCLVTQIAKLIYIQAFKKWY